LVSSYGAYHRFKHYLVLLMATVVVRLIVLVKYNILSFIESSSFGKLNLFVHRKDPMIEYEIEFVVNTFTYCYLYKIMLFFHRLIFNLNKIVMKQIVSFILR